MIVSSVKKYLIIIYTFNLCTNEFKWICSRLSIIDSNGILTFFDLDAKITDENGKEVILNKILVLNQGSAFFF